MKKKCDFLPPRRQRWKFNFSLRMRLLVTLLLVGALHVSANSVAQTKVSLTMKNAAVEEVFQRLESMTGYTFLYNLDLLKGCGRVDVDARDEDFSQLLAGVLKPLGLAFTIDDRVVVITRDDEKKAPKELIIKGRVLMKDSTSLPGATVIVKGTSVGVVTDNNGRFTLTLPEMKHPVLVFSFVGLKTKEVRYEGKDMVVVMEHEVKEVDEVVVTGYGNVTKGNYTGASTTVKAEDILMAGVSSIDQMLQGVVPGMLVMNKTGLVGATPKIRVRGTSTLLGSQEPVWVVDGVIQHDPQPFDPEENTKFSVDADDIKELAGNAISWLNPNDIESITVLKDASATAIYGSQAANGVIVITTKKAQVGRVQVSYSGDFSIGQRPRYGLYDLMNSAERMQLSKEIYEEKRYQSSGLSELSIGFESLLERYRNKEATITELQEEYIRMAKQNTDWFDILFRNSFNHSHNLSISGGSEKVQNRTSFSFSQENGEAKGNGMTHFSVTSNTTANLWDRVTVNMSLNASIREVDGFAYGVDPFSYAYETSRVIPCYNEDGSLYYHEKRGASSYVFMNKYSYNYNILNEKANTGSENKTRVWGATIDLKWQFFLGLEYQGLFAYSSSSADTKQWASEKSFYITQTRGYEYGYFLPSDEEIAYTPLPMGGMLETDLTNTTTVTVRNSLVYDKLINDKHRVTLQVGIETNSVKTKGETNTRYGYMPDRGETFAVPPAQYLNSWGTTTDNTEIAQGMHSVLNRVDNKLSEYGMAVYTYDDRYVLNLSGRVDASNRFGQDRNKRFQPTWSVGLKWRIANEPFVFGKWWLNNLDIYGSYGYQGNAVSTVSPELITTFTNVYLYNNVEAQEIVSVPYPNLGWEKTKTWNMGVEGSMLHGRLNFTFNYFEKISDVLSSRSIPFENGANNGIVSGTTMKNHGYDLIVNVIPVQMKDVTWQLSVNTSIAHNKVETQRVNTMTDYTSGTCLLEGQPFSTFYSYIFTGLDDNYGQPMFKNVEDQDPSQLGWTGEAVESITDLLVESGKLTPDFSGGFNTMFKWKNISLYALFAVQWGGHNRLPNLYASTNGLEGELPRAEQNASRKLKERWKKVGDKTNVPSLPGTGHEAVFIPGVKNLEISYNQSNKYYLYNLSNVRVANTDFIRCRQLSLSYDFKGEWMERAGISYFQVKASMTNPFMWVSDKKWDGLDPETADWPTRRVTSFSLQIMF